MSNPKVYNELKRLFGADNVSEEFIKPPAEYASEKGNQSEWCYIVTVAQDSPLLSNAPTGRIELCNIGTRIESFLFDRLDIPSALIDTHVSGDAPNLLHDTSPMRIVLPIKDIDTEQNLAALQNISPEAISHAAEYGAADKLHAMHMDTLHRASNGLRWEFISDKQGDYYQTMRQLKMPDNLRDLILLKLGRSNDELSSHNGCARIGFDSLSKGNIGALMETILPRAVCIPSRPTQFSELS